MLALLDFDDSFTLNIYCELKLLGLEAQVVPRGQTREFLETNISTRHRLATILGPGPGHPDEYDDVLASLPRFLKRENSFLMGICLGHQLIGRALGMRVGRSKFPVHGEVQRIELGQARADWFGEPRMRELSVQRYNSLAIGHAENLDLFERLKIDVIAAQDEVQAMKGEGFIAYQFHPESVGTSFRPRFFMPLRAFLL